ncbi:MAG: hypothetical protein ACRDLD_06455 [Thermoleophilaceae bacterium]
MGVLWALRADDGRIRDFAFGYGNASILRSFRLSPSTHERYALLEALPQMRGSHAFDAYVSVCETGRPWVEEVNYDTPFGDGYMLGTFVQRTAKLGDGLVVFPRPRSPRSIGATFRCSSRSRCRPDAVVLISDLGTRSTSHPPSCHGCDQIQNDDQDERRDRGDGRADRVTSGCLRQATELLVTARTRALSPVVGRSPSPSRAPSADGRSARRT